jgi:hypothetical protein
MLNFQGFQAELDMEEDFFSCAQCEKRNIVQLLPKVPTVKGSSSGSF